MDKGIILERRKDISKYHQIMYKEILSTILNKTNFDNLISAVEEEIKFLLDGNVDIENLIIRKRYNANYKTSNHFMYKLCEEKEIGENIEFIVIKPNRRILIENYSNEDIDYQYYIDYLIKHINPMIKIAYPDKLCEDEHLKYVGYIDIFSKKSKKSNINSNNYKTNFQNYSVDPPINEFNFEQIWTDHTRFPNDLLQNGVNQFQKEHVNEQQVLFSDDDIEFPESPNWYDDQDFSEMITQCF